MKTYMYNIKLLIRNNNKIMVACSLIYRILGDSVNLLSVGNG